MVSALRARRHALQRPKRARGLPETTHVLGGKRKARTLSAHRRGRGGQAHLAQAASRGHRETQRAFQGPLRSPRFGAHQGKARHRAFRPWSGLRLPTGLAPPSRARFGHEPWAQSLPPSRLSNYDRASASYQLQQSINGGAYTNVALPSATATTISRSLAPGTNTYRYRVAAKDKAGNLSAWASGPSFKVTAFQESSSAIVDTGTWTTSALSGAYGGSVQSASALGRDATFTVPTGTKNVAWVSYRGNRGKAQVWLDGVQQDAKPSVTGIQPFDLYSSTVQVRKVVFSKAVSPTTTHKLEVRVLGKKNTSSTSTRVDIDAFVTTN